MMYLKVYESQIKQKVYAKLLNIITRINGMKTLLKHFLGDCKYSCHYDGHCLHGIMRQLS